MVTNEIQWRFDLAHHAALATDHAPQTRAWDATSSHATPASRTRPQSTRQQTSVHTCGQRTQQRARDPQCVLALDHASARSMAVSALDGAQPMRRPNRPLLRLHPPRRCMRCAGRTAVTHLSAPLPPLRSGRLCSAEAAAAAHSAAHMHPPRKGRRRSAAHMHPPRKGRRRGARLPAPATPPTVAHPRGR
jgi:hypothetical protein